MANGKRALCTALRETLTTLDEMNVRGANAEVVEKTKADITRTLAKHGCKE